MTPLMRVRSFQWPVALDFSEPAAGWRRVVRGLAQVEALERRLLFSAGDLDLSFGNGGWLTHDFGGEEHAFSPTVLPDGSIEMGMSIKVGDRYELRRVRLMPDGSFEMLGGEGVTQIIEVRPIDLSNGQRLEALMLPGGGQWDYWDFAVVRYNADGTLDQSFSVDGVARLDINGKPNYITSMAVDEQGRIVVVGTANSTDMWGNMYDIGVARFNADGSLDTTFGQGGWMTIDTNEAGVFVGTESIGAIAFSPDGRMVLGGSTSNAFMSGEYAVDRFLGGALLVRLNGDGTLDSSFGDGGIQVISLPDTDPSNMTLSSGGISRLWLMENGTIRTFGIMSADGKQGLAWLQINADGTLGETFGGGGGVYLYGSVALGDLTQRADESWVGTGVRNSDDGTFFIVSHFDSEGRLVGALEQRIEAGSEWVNLGSATVDEQGRVVVVGTHADTPMPPTSPEYLDATRAWYQTHDAFVARYHALDEGLPGVGADAGILVKPVARFAPGSELPPAPAPDPGLPEEPATPPGSGEQDPSPLPVFQAAAGLFAAEPAAAPAWAFSPVRIDPLGELPEEQELLVGLE